MAELTDKEKVIKEVYEDKEKGLHRYGILINRHSNKTVALSTKMINKYLDKQSFRQTQCKYKGLNSFISAHPLFELEVDLIDLTRKSQENDGYRYCMVATDNFTKFAWGVAIKDKQPTDVVNAFKEILDKIGTPEQIYSVR